MSDYWENEAQFVHVLGLTHYGPLGASSRMRTYQYPDALAEFGVDLRVSELTDDCALEFFYKQDRRLLGPPILGYAKRIGLLGCEQNAGVLLVVGRDASIVITSNRGNGR